MVQLYSIKQLTSCLPLMNPAEMETAVLMCCSALQVICEMFIACGNATEFNFSPIVAVMEEPVDFTADKREKTSHQGVVF